MKPVRAVARAGLVAIAVVAMAMAAACAGTPDDASRPALAVSELDYAGYAASVQPVLERRCGSLDCHGQLPRGLRVYGWGGMRLTNDAGLVPGGGATTADEARATYVSVMALQPERMQAIIAKPNRTPDDAYSLLLLTKPLQLERHKGGASLVKGEPAEQCIVSWLLGTVNADLCAKGAAPL